MTSAPASDGSTPESRIADLTELLEVEELDRDLYRGRRKKGGVGRIFGGQVIAQALMSACRSIEDDRVAHSLHGYFLRPGDEDLPILFRIARDFDGGSFSNRRVVATQKGVPILNLAASFQRPEEGLAHATSMPDVPPPEALPPLADSLRAHSGRLPERMPFFLTRPGPIELRPVQSPPFLSGAPGEPVAQCWFRAVAPVRDDPLLHRVMLAYVSDMMLLGTSLRPHGLNWGTSRMQSASIDHALWFHGDARIDDWLLYSTESPWSGQGRGFTRGMIHTRGGRLVASVAQEGLIRIRDDGGRTGDAAGRP